MTNLGFLVFDPKFLSLIRVRAASRDIGLSAQRVRDTVSERSEPPTRVTALARTLRPNAVTGDLRFEFARYRDFTAATPGLTL
jgi:hypothetical protein